MEKWINVNSFQIEATEKYTNIIIPDDVKLSNIFLSKEKFEWMDGFSPNLNKELHIGHFSNFVLGKAFKSLGVCDKIVSIYGDTLDGSVSKEDSIKALNCYLNDFQYFIDKSFMASEMTCNDDLLKNGEDKYEGTKIFEAGEDKVVGVKSTGQTSYFYQDVALAQTLNASTLYLTGKEQCNHFDVLKKLFPHIHHIGLGLVKVSGMKMASRIGNVVLMKDFIEQMKDTFEGNLQLIYNVFAGFILKSSPEVDKGIDLDMISNPKNSAGLYLSYTMARLMSAGCESRNSGSFNSKELEFAYLKASFNLKPNILFEGLVDHCKEINLLYMNHVIKNNDDNKKMFDVMLSDLIFGCVKLGLFIIDKV